MMTTIPAAQTAGTSDCLAFAGMGGPGVVLGGCSYCMPLECAGSSFNTRAGRATASNRSSSGNGMKLASANTNPESQKKNPAVGGPSSSELMIRNTYFGSSNSSLISSTSSLDN